MNKIGFGGSCHWCTEAIFLSLKGIIAVDQGWIASDSDAEDFSEAVIVEFDRSLTSLEQLIAVHLYTHSCTSQHSMRDKYRSAIYTFDDSQVIPVKNALHDLQREFSEPIITKVLPFRIFKLNAEPYRNYYYNDPSKPFCENIVNPKLRELLQRFPKLVDPEKFS